MLYCLWSLRLFTTQMFTENEPTFSSFLFHFFWGWGRNYCFLIKYPLWWWVWLFQANVDDTSQNRCWFRVEQIETGNSSVAKISNSSGVKLPMWKIALTVMMLFYLLLRLKLSFTSNASTDASFPSNACLCCTACVVVAGVPCCACARTERTQDELDQRTFSLKSIHKLLPVQELLSVVYTCTTYAEANCK